MLGLEGQDRHGRRRHIADIIIVDGDPVNDIRVLQDKRRIETVIQDGQPVVFDEEARSGWPHERGQAYSTTTSPTNRFTARRIPQRYRRRGPADKAMDVVRSVQRRELGAARE